MSVTAEFFRARSAAMPENYSRGQRLGWAAARYVFIFCAAVSLFTVVGGLLLAPANTWYFFNDWRFWRHWRRGLGLYGQGYRMFWLMLRGDDAFMLSVPMTSAPRRKPRRSVVVIRADWQTGNSCGSCSRCCGQCPLRDVERNLCLSYNSFYWRYFNCGRFPYRQSQIDYYQCEKWAMRPAA
jgi:hypothetical protein